MLVSKNPLKSLRWLSASGISRRSRRCTKGQNGKVESLNGLIGSMLTKLLLGKSTKLWAIRMPSSRQKRLPFYLVYGNTPGYWETSIDLWPEMRKSRTTKQWLAVA